RLSGDGHRARDRPAGAGADERKRGPRLGSWEWEPLLDRAPCGRPCRNLSQYLYIPLSIFMDESMSWQGALSRPGPQSPLVQFYGEEQMLARNVAYFVQEGAQCGDRTLIVTTPRHAKLFREQLRASGIPTDPLERDRRLQFFDVETTLASFMVDD